MAGEVRRYDIVPNLQVTQKRGVRIHELLEPMEEDYVGPTISRDVTSEREARFERYAPESAVVKCLLGPAHIFKPWRRSHFE